MNKSHVIYIFEMNIYIYIYLYGHLTQYTTRNYGMITQLIHMGHI